MRGDLRLRKLARELLNFGLLLREVMKCPGHAVCYL